MPNSELVQSLLRGLDILQLIASKGEGARLNELAEAAQLHKSTLHNLLRTLAAREFVFKDSLNRYRLGDAVLQLAQKAGKTDIEEALRSQLLRLAILFPDHVLTVSTIRNGKIRCLMRVSPDQADVLQTPAEQFFMPYTSVTAIALQSANPELEPELEKNFPFDEFGIGKWGSLKKFAQLKKQVLQDGFCCQITPNRSAAAFIMPENLVLGFSVPRQMTNILEKYSAAAHELRRAVWKK